MDLSKYKSFIFDCDGVILNSNKIKARAFFTSSSLFGDYYASKLLDYHLANGGVSRYQKFRHFISEILPPDLILDTDKTSLLNLLLDRYANIVKSLLRDCEVALGLDQLRTHYPDVRWHVVSGGDQEELRDLFSHRSLDTFFDGQIFGSPDDKSTILQREIDSHNILLPAVFFGDSRYDYIASHSFGIDFIFISSWTELVDWQLFISQHNIMSVDSIQYL